MDTTGEIIVTLASNEKHYSYERLSVSYDSTDSEILDALSPVLMEEEGFNIKEEQRDGYFTIKRVDSSKNTYVFPKSTAGFSELFCVIDFTDKNILGENDFDNRIANYPDRSLVLVTKEQLQTVKNFMSSSIRYIKTDYAPMDLLVFDGTENHVILITARQMDKFDLSKVR